MIGSMHQESDDTMLTDLTIYQSYRRSPYLSRKHSSYFPAYQDLLERYRNKPIVFLEVGILNGGSLFMWRDFFGPAARIIGVELNPEARKWEQSGFEIYIGSQSDPKFWRDLFEKIGPVDVILDDGGHTNEQQIVTVCESLPFVRDGGMVIVEDTHTSYFREFGNPSPYSFMNFAKSVVDEINGRCPWVRNSKHQRHNYVWSVAFYESIVCFNVNRTKSFVSWPTSNSGASSNAQDYRHHQSPIDILERLRGRISSGPSSGGMRRLAIKAVNVLSYFLVRFESRKLRRYF
jgi:cephalosporin hydroxylase